MLKAAGRAGVVVGALLALLLIAPPRVAHACSGGEPYDPNEAAAIVEGRVEGVRLRPELGYAGWRPMPVEVTLRVARVIWGAAPGTITFIDYSGASRLPDGSIQFGSGGNTCSILDADPTGKYALIVLRRDSEGRLAAHKIQGAAFGDGPDASDVRRLRQRITGQLRPTDDQEVLHRSPRDRFTHRRHSIVATNFGPAQIGA
jgi:hypothetical protein